MTVKAHTYYIIFGRPPIGEKLPPFPLAAPPVTIIYSIYPVIHEMVCTESE